MSDDGNALQDDDLDFVPAKFPAVSEIIAAIAGAVPFGFSLSSSSSETINGQVVEASYFDPVAVAGGAVAVLAALWSFVLLRKTMAAQKSIRLVAGLALVGLGAFQLARGLGYV